MIQLVYSRALHPSLDVSRISNVAIFFSVLFLSSAWNLLCQASRPQAHHQGPLVVATWQRQRSALKNVGFVSSLSTKPWLRVSTHRSPSETDLCFWTLATSLLLGSSSRHAVSMTHPRLSLPTGFWFSRVTVFSVVCPAEPWTELCGVVNTSDSEVDFCPWINVTTISGWLLSRWYTLTVLLTLNS